MTTTTRRNPLAAREAQPVALASEGREQERLYPDQIRTDGGTQMRAGLNEATVVEYLEAITGPNEWPFPPVIVFYDGATYWLGDGFHRVEGGKRFAERERIRFSIPAIVYAGTRRDAVLYAAAANADHGLRRTNADKRRSVETLLRDEEWSQWSDREIARRCKVSDRFVNAMRKELFGDVTANDSQLNQRTYTTKHGTTATMNVTGQRQAAQSRTVEASVPVTTQHEWPAALEAAGCKVEQRDGWYMVRMGTQFETLRDMGQAIAAGRRMVEATKQPKSAPEPQAEEADEADEPQAAEPTNLADCTHRGQIFITPMMKSPGVRSAHILLCEDCGHFQAVIEVAFQKHTVDFRLDSEMAIEAATRSVVEE